jgi:acyl carrier protein
MDRADLDTRVAQLIDDATGGAVPAADALDGDTPLFELGLDSLGWLRLIDAIEIAYQIDLDLSGSDLRLITVGQIVDRLASARPLGSP